MYNLLSMIVGKSFKECTAISASPFNRYNSTYLVNTPIPPIVYKGSIRLTSPIAFLTGTI